MTLRRRTAAVAAGAVLLAIVGCRSSRSADESPLVPGTPLDRITAIRSATRIRVVTPEKTHSFRAQLLVEPSSERMLLTAYTPVGTTALTFHAAGDAVLVLDHVNKTAWRGSAAQLSQSIGLFGAASPARWAMAVLGYPSELGDATVVSEPAGVVPARQSTLTRGVQRVEVTNLDVFTTSARAEAPEVPPDYRCCVQPRL